MINEKTVLEKLDKSSIKYQLIKHPAFFTVSDSIKYRGSLRGGHSKNLFLKNKKNQFFLFSCIEETKVDLKKISKSLNIGNISFANEDLLKKYLGVLPGSVSPFGLLNDIENKVQFYLDSEFLSEKTINFHPLTNTSTVNLDTNEFINFLIENKKKVNIFNFKEYSLIY